MALHIKDHLGHEQCVYVSGGKEDQITKVTSTKDSIVSHSDQEEADTRLILHAVMAAEAGANRIVINSPDTDVLMLLLHHRPRINADELYFYAGKRFMIVSGLLNNVFL